MGVPSDGSYGIPEGVIYGYPVTCEGGKYKIVKGLADQRLQPHAHGRHAQGAAGRARRHRAPDRVTSHSAGARLRAAMAAEKPLQCVGTINAYHARARRARRLQVDLPLRRRRRRGLARPARPRHQQPRRRAHRRAPHHRRVRAAAAGGRRHRLRRERVQHRAHGEVPHQGGRGGHAHRGPGRRQALRAPPGQGARLAAGDGRTASRPRPTRRPIPTSW